MSAEIIDIFASAIRKAEAASSTAARPIESIGVGQIFAPLPPIPWLVEKLRIAPGRPTMLAGYSYSGKTITAQAIALAVAAGRPVFGAYRARQGKVLHLDFEMGQYLARSRYQRLAAGMGIDVRELGDDGLRLATYPTMRLSDTTAEERLTAACDGCALVVLDSFTAAAGDIEENSAEAGAPFYMLGRVSDRVGCTFVVIHHARKPQKDASGGARMAIRGSSAIYGGCDAVYAMGGEKGEPVRVQHEKSPYDGIIVEDFCLKVVDVPGVTGPRHGMRVEQLETAEVATDPRAEREHEALMRAVVDTIARAGGELPGGVKTLTVKLQRRRANLDAAVAELEAKGVVESVVKRGGAGGTSSLLKLRRPSVPSQVSRDDGGTLAPDASSGRLLDQSYRQVTERPGNLVDDIQSKCPPPKGGDMRDAWIGASRWQPTGGGHDAELPPADDDLSGPWDGDES
jgi:hypothetical protein